MEYEVIDLVGGPAGFPPGVELNRIDVRTGIHSSQRDHHIAKHHDTTHTVQAKNASHRTLFFRIDSRLPDGEVRYPDGEHSTPRKWTPTIKVGGLRSGRESPQWEPAKTSMSHPATCPEGNGHHVDIAVNVETALEGETGCILKTEQDYVFRFTCTC
ncbi:hypothetical protein [Nocardioides acrostichi]|uniref:Uncharacterized protein n=1 Tax=Nocardioides acrostichi TaxID=2784339 RepID=A0A930V2V3_9ACTN|nr:hypothetical protein [Nocardioides acrostichi]MBF4163660.1 hypothetical protein [Nocardioides acrostichi]